MGKPMLSTATTATPLVLATLATATLPPPTDTTELTAPLPQPPELASLSVDTAPLPLLEPTLHMVMLPAADMLLIPLELSTLPRERLRLNQRLMLSMELMDMVLALDTLLDMALATPDPSMEDILPSPVTLLQPLLLDTLDLDTQEPSMEDMVATMAKETLKLSQRLRLMPPMVLMEDMVLVLDTPAMLLQLLPELLLLAMLLQLFPDQLLPAMLLQLLPAMLPLLLLPMLLQLLLLQSSPDQLLPAMLLPLLPLVMLVLPDPQSPAMPDMVMDVSTKP